MPNRRSKRLLHTPQTIIRTGSAIRTARCGALGAKEGMVHSFRRSIPRTNCAVLQPDNLNASGYDMVLAQAMYAIVGAVSLEQGGAVANKITKERILAHIGLRPHMVGNPEQLRI